MRVVIQRVLEASVVVGDDMVGATGPGMLVLCGFEAADTEEDLEWTARKTVALRIFDDENGVMNRSVLDIEGGILAVSQFTLMASTRKGNRPSYVAAAPLFMNASSFCFPRNSGGLWSADVSALR